MSILKKLLFVFCGIFFITSPIDAFADWKIVDAFDVSPAVPIVLDAFMRVATGTYDFFVANGHGIIHLLIWGFLALTIASYALKLFFPKEWVGFLGFSAGPEIGKQPAMNIAYDILKPSLRAIIAVVVLLQIKPIFITNWLINPFLEFGSYYTTEVSKAVNNAGIQNQENPCPETVIQQGWISEKSCNYLTTPVKNVTYANNKIIKRGLESITNGLRSLLTTFIANAGESFVNIITGILLVYTFVSCNVLMALLIIQAILDFGMALILYPFNVLVWVVKKSDKWMDLFPPFSGIVNGLKKMVITMIACSFILCINIVIVRIILQTNSSVFSVAAGGSATSNVPAPAMSGATSFGQHAMIWLSCLLTFFLMTYIFNLTRDKLKNYTGSGSSALYDSVTNDAKGLWGGTKNIVTSITNIRKLVGK